MLPYRIFFLAQAETAILAQCCHLLLKFIATTNTVTHNYKGVASVSKAGRKKAENREHFTAQVCRQ